MYWYIYYILIQRDLETGKLTYKQIMARFAKDNMRRRKQTVALIKITVCAFAACLLLLCVLLVVDLATGGVDTDRGDGKDRTPPVIKLKKGSCIYMYAGENVSFRDKVRVSDEGGDASLEFESHVNRDAPGTYEVIYTATDEAGNVSRLSVTVVVTKEEYSYDVLMTEIEALAKRLGITSAMSKQEQVEAVYDYVNSPTKTKNDANIYFSDESNIPGIDRVNWQIDWVEEAARTLKSKEGDCYSYYSVSKAFFEFLEIDNMGIKRDESKSNMQGTHFWLMVNIGSASAEKWYFYDPTRLAGEFSDGTNSGCLRTFAELEAYTPSNPDYYGFYAFDKSSYPATATTPIDR